MSNSLNTQNKMYILRYNIILPFIFGLYTIRKVIEGICMPWVDVVGLAVAILCVQGCTYTYKNQKAAEELCNVIYGLIYCSVNVFCFINFFDYKKIHDTQGTYTTNLPFNQMLLELAFYSAHLIIEIAKKDKMMTVHHVLAVFALLVSHTYNYHHLLCASLAIFSMSNAPLALAKYARAVKKETLAQLSFLIFTVTFMIFRVFTLPAVLKLTLIDGFSNSDIVAYVSINTLLLSLYAMQLVWAYKITMIFLNMLLRN